MKLTGKAYVVEDMGRKSVCIETATDSGLPLIVRTYGMGYHDSAENLCLSLNSWRESFAQDDSPRREMFGV